jgi:hypothetical protein
MKYKHWTLWRQRQAQLASHRFCYPAVPGPFAWRYGAAGQMSGRRTFPPSSPGPSTNQAAGPRPAPRFFFPPGPDPNLVCGQWDYRKQI